MAADSSMGFHQGITTSVYNHHMLSFQSSSDGGINGGGVTGSMVMAPRNVSGTSSNAGLYLSPNTGVIRNSSGVGPSRSSSGDVLHGSGTGSPKYKFVTGSPSDWSDQELSILKEGLVRYAREPNIMKYIKIAAMLPKRTIRDVALRWLYPEAAPVVDSATQHLLEENNQLLNQIAANIETFKAEDNMNLFLRMSSNIKEVLSRMSETPGIMGQMPSLPVSVNENHLNSLLQLNRMVRSHNLSHRMSQQDHLIIQSKSHGANVPYIEGEENRRSDDRSFPSSVDMLQEMLTC
ncbi:hypothetical protein PR202_ga18619 [Eleusine coracana subsp. coracana]|uniref:Uncharacterized protein n=1 Tax=Eleusine coracana subsp. coracana TaxID=191504 RepID=A0AAV5CTT3_ELECO|nr:hypothetical protein PR202_ga18619 [Eleusine coracana subsp. coracana]